MQIASKTIVSFHYTLRNVEGDILESSDGGEPNSYLHGANNIIRGLERELTGHSPGDQLRVEVESGQAYGERNENLRQRVPVKHLIYKGKIKPGMAVQLNTREGRRSVTVIKAGRHSVDIDGNHPLAGQSLIFDIDIQEVRDASPEELAHGHAHGPGGHQH